MGATDGRLQRSVRSRERIVLALMELIQEGVLLPTGGQVAARADVGLRTVFRHFEDMESLHSEFQARVKSLAAPLMEERLPDGTLEARITAFVRRRAAVFERIAPFKRSGRLQAWRSPVVRESQEAMVRSLRSELRRVLPELEALPRSLQNAVELVTSFEGWDRLRTEQNLGRERAQESMRDAVLVLLDA
jgi:AcrR family transcriptional regulator